jgi:hypothetical protein
MKRALGLGLLLSAIASAPAHAVFHLWDVSEVYSNADGSVQFVEFSTGSDFQDQLIGHELQATAEGIPSMIYTFPVNLPSTATGGKHFLFASEGFEAVAGVAPDYEWTGAAYPFIHVGVDDALTLVGADGIGLANLPTDGALSLLGDEVTTAVPTPTNFAGVTGTLPEPGGAAAALTAVAVLAVRARRVAPGRRR